MRKLEINEIKNLELDLLKSFDSLCKKNDLYYTMCGGTLLGAVRHKGFIPWDDDIDVLMPRPDYERLLNQIDIDLSELPEYMKLCSWKSGDLNNPFMKMVDTRTQVSLDYFNPEISVKHIWIDIFPIDGNPDDKKELKKIYNRSLCMRRILSLKLADVHDGKSRLKKLLKPWVVKMLKPISVQQLCDKINRDAQKYDFDQAEYIGGIVWGYGPQERIKKKDYLVPIRMEFEGVYFNAPSNYDEYLKGLYKDYMKLPPIEKRVVHGIHAYMEDGK